MVGLTQVPISAIHWPAGNPPRPFKRCAKLPAEIPDTKRRDCTGQYALQNAY
jgi:hypothetical protein